MASRESAARQIVVELIRSSPRGVSAQELESYVGSRWRRCVESLLRTGQVELYQGRYRVPPPRLPSYLCARCGVLHVRDVIYTASAVVCAGCGQDVEEAGDWL